MAWQTPSGRATPVESAHRPDLFVHQLIERAGLRDPEGVALRHGARTLSHRDLTQRAKRLAAHLLDRGIAPGSVVAVRLDRSFDQIIACLAILHAGSAFMA